MSQKEIPVSDDELAALMAELEEATGVPAEAPAPTPAPARVAAPEPEAEPAPEPAADADELEALAALEAGGQPEPEPAVTQTPVVEEDDMDAQLAALEAQLDRAREAEAAAELEAAVASGTAVAEEIAAAASEPAPEPAAEPEPTPRRVVVHADGTKTMPNIGGPASPAAPVNEEDDGMPAPKAKAPALDFYVDVDDFRRTTTVTDTNLDECMIQQSGLRAFYGAQAARAEAQHARLKVRFEVLEAKLFDEHRKLLTATGEKVTEKAVENAVRLDPRYLQGKTRVIEAESIANVNRAMVDSLRDRASMVIQLCADRRDEFKGQARVMAQQQERDELRARAFAAASRAAA
ncbi:hypothetical protein N5B55_04700 [Ralstonia pickettii]|uniref:hypothetical protein n=1 Tax=Ralstonia pickettii TaxID=329 RepID=UPI0027148B85|nr:hypothetical protein [Ralstonia pickettii]WKZ86252.1 hypothetical protein N5B55_04700 [Ralstonia pickettii]